MMMTMMMMCSWSRVQVQVGQAGQQLNTRMQIFKGCKPQRVRTHPTALHHFPILIITTRLGSKTRVMQSEKGVTGSRSSGWGDDLVPGGSSAGSPLRAAWAVFLEAWEPLTEHTFTVCAVLAPFLSLGFLLANITVKHCFFSPPELPWKLHGHVNKLQSKNKREKKVRVIKEKIKKVPGWRTDSPSVQAQKHRGAPCWWGTTWLNLVLVFSVLNH